MLFIGTHVLTTLREYAQQSSRVLVKAVTRSPTR